MRPIQIQIMRSIPVIQILLQWWENLEQNSLPTIIEIEFESDCGDRT